MSPRKNRLIFEKGGKQPRKFERFDEPSNSAYWRILLTRFQAPIYKNVEFTFFAQALFPKYIL